MERSHTIMAKWIKKLLGLAAIGSAAAGLVYCFKKSKKDVDEDFNDDFEDEDFDLDNDLQPIDREYVDLNAGKTSPEETEDVEKTEETDETDEAESNENTLNADTHEDEAD